MKKLFTAIPFLLLVTCTYSQQLSQVTFSGGSSLSYFSLVTDRNVLIRISVDGKIMEWGTEVQSLRSSNFYAPNLQPYMGRVEYYGPESDSLSRGKVKSIGTANITYYGSYETETKIGKTRSIGSLILDYYSDFDDKALKGKIKFIGNLVLQYYSSFDIDGFSGRLKAVGSNSISYYSSFEDKFIKGKIKSIGPLTYSWYTSLDIGRGVGLKSGSYRQKIGAVTYILGQ